MFADIPSISSGKRSCANFQGKWKRTSILFATGLQEADRPFPIVDSFTCKTIGKFLSFILATNGSNRRRFFAQVQIS